MKKQELKDLVRLQKIEIEDLKRQLEESNEYLKEEMECSGRLRARVQTAEKSEAFHKDQAERWSKHAMESEKHCAWALKLVNDAFASNKQEKQTA